MKDHQTTALFLQSAPPKYGKAAHDPIPEDETPFIDKEGLTQVQRVFGSILWYAHAVNLMVAMVLSTIAAEQYQATNKTIKNFEQLM